MRRTFGAAFAGISFVLLCFTASDVFAQALPAPSSWQNQRRSVMSVVAVDPTTGAIKGQYTNNAAGFACQGVPFDLGGKTSGNKVTLIVVWKNATMSCDSITVWKGRVSGNKIRTRWELSYVNGAGSIKELRGADAFERTQ
jgi:hypothetical protein